MAAVAPLSLNDLALMLSSQYGMLPPMPSIPLHNGNFCVLCSFEILFNFFVFTKDNNPTMQYGDGINNNVIHYALPSTQPQQSMLQQQQQQQLFQQLQQQQQAYLQGSLKTLSSLYFTFKQLTLRINQ